MRCSSLGAAGQAVDQEKLTQCLAAQDSCCRPPLGKTREPLLRHQPHLCTQPEHCSDRRPLVPMRPLIPTWPGQLAAECSSCWGGRPGPGAFGPLPGALAQKSFPTDAAQPRGAGLVLWFHPRGAGGQVRAPHSPRATPGRRQTGRGLLGFCM